MDKKKVLIGAIAAITTGVAATIIKVVKNRNKEEVIEVELEDESRD